MLDHVSLYDEVWCSQLDEDKIRQIFIVTPVIPKIFVKRGLVLLVKVCGEHHQPGFIGRDVSQVTIFRMEQ